MRTTVGLLAALLLLATTASAQDGIPADGTDILRGLLKYHGFTPVQALDADPANTLVVVVGSTNLPEAMANLIRKRVLPNGGTLLVITERPGGLGRLFPNASGALVSVASVQCDVKNACFGGNVDAPLAYLRDGDPTGVAAFNIGQPLALATNRPHALELDGDGVLNTEVARFAEASRYANEAIHGRRFIPSLAVRSNPGLPYTALVYADRAMFSNGLMTATAPDGMRTSNFLYSVMLTRFLAGQLNGRGAKACYFVEDGQVLTDFDRVGFVDQPGDGKIPPVPPGGIPKIPLPILADKAFDVANNMVVQAEEKDLPNAVQAKDPQNRIQDGVLYAVAIFGSVVLLRYAMARAWSLRQSPDHVPRLRIDPDRGGGLIPERRLGLLQSGNLYEPLRDHLRFVFAKWGITAPDPGQLPDIGVDRKTRPVGRIVADLRRLWFIAYIPDRVTITPDDLEEYEDMIADLAHAHDTGIWRFTDGGAA